MSNDPKCFVDGVEVPFEIVQVPVYARESWWQTILRHLRATDRPISHYESAMRLVEPPPAGANIVLLCDTQEPADG
jgi:hypothetical protein